MRWGGWQTLLVRWDPLLLLILVGIFTFSHWVMTSASPERLDDQLLHQGLALAALLVAALIPFRWWLALSPLLYLGGLLALVLVLMVGVTAKGATRWLDLGVARVQPSELMKLAVPLFVAAYFHWRQGVLRWWDHLVALLWVVMPTLLILKQPDLGTAIMVGVIGGCVLFFAGLSWRVILPLSAVAAVAIAAFIHYGAAWCAPEVQWPGLHDYQKGRICTLLDPERDPLGKGFHTIQAAIAIGSGGFWGKGLGQGTQAQLAFIPERHTDFILAVIAEELGFVGVSGLFAGYFLLLLRLLALALRSGLWAGQLFGGAAVAAIFIYTWVNAAMVMGIAPVVGVPLPFVSYGGTALMSLCLMVGVVASAAAERPLSGGRR
ncbi:rod shape-determining protein RodA [Hydrogenophilus islandicus]